MISLHDFVRPVMSTLKGLCWVMLGFYVLRVGIFVVQGPPEGRAPRHGMREAMAMAYTVVAAYFIASATSAIQLFVYAILDSVSLLRTTPAPWILGLLVLSSACVCAAFICTFSRSLWMLKTLDHAIFGPVPEWAELSEQSPGKKITEFATRTAAALLFIVVEFRLERFADVQTSRNALTLASIDQMQHSSLAQAGLWGLWLYFALTLWWLVGLWIARQKMPKLQLFFYIAGMVNSLFIFKYAGTVTSSDDALTLLLSIVVVLISALYMLGYLLLDPIRDLYGLRAWVRTPASTPTV
jgi:hypothetical protein